MTQRDDFVHPYDTPASSGLRFLAEVIAWVSGPWAISLISGWLVIPTVVCLIGLPSVFSTVGDKRNVIVPTPGPLRVAIEDIQYLTAGIAPWFVWGPVWAGVSVAVVVGSVILGLPRWVWLLKGAPPRAG